MFERFSQAAREVVVRAQAEARAMRHSTIGTQHFLLALTTDTGGAVARELREQGVDEAAVRAAIGHRRGGATPAADPPPDTDDEDAAALKAIGIDLDQVRRAIEANFGPGALRLSRTPEEPKRGLFGRVRGHLPLTPRAKKALEFSLRAAVRLQYRFIGPEHLMLGLLRDEDSTAAAILAEAHVDRARLRSGLTRSLDRAA